ncbi:MAG TPA: HWE histidine kinase domain-containing protein [Pseudolabrys sp.]|nr:HWE histidine kinase domain-containing protein [Pseudolabrys sp.]
MNREHLGRTLADTETRLALATEAASIGIWDWDLLTNEITYSGRAKEICGFPVDQPVTYEQVVAVTHPEDLPRTSGMARRALDPDKREQQPYEYRLRLADGRVRWVLAYGQAIFAEVDGRDRAIRYIGTIQDITSRHETEAQLRDSESRLRLALDAAKMAVWEYDVATERVTFSPELNALFGFADGRAAGIEEIRARYLPGERERLRAAGRAALERGETYYEIDFQVARMDGEQRWLLLRAEIQLSGQREPVRVLGVVFDVTEQKKSAERQVLLVSELNHRVKNTLSIVQSITKLTLRHAPNHEQAAADIEGRILSLSQAHDLLTEQSWEHLSLRQLATRALSIADDGRISLRGPDIWLRPRLAVDLSMVLHELLTNAVKYGSLAVEEGRVDITWSKQKNNVVALTWIEHHGPALESPRRKGLGSSLIQNVIKEHDGAAEMKFKPEGVSWSITFRMDSDDRGPVKRPAGATAAP